MFLILGLIKRARPVFGLKKILNKVSKLKPEPEEGEDEGKLPPKYLRIPIIVRRLRGQKIAIKWFKESCLLF